MAKKIIKAKKAIKGQKKPPGKTILSVYIDESLKRRLASVAKKRDMSASKLVHMLILDHIDDLDELGDFMTRPEVKSGIRFLLKNPDALTALMAANDIQPSQQNMHSLFGIGEDSDENR